MQSTFCFADVKILAVPTTSPINNFWHLRTVNLIFVGKKGLDAMSALENDLKINAATKRSLAALHFPMETASPEIFDTRKFPVYFPALERVFKRLVCAKPVCRVIVRGCYPPGYFFRIIKILLLNSARYLKKTCSLKESLRLVTSSLILEFF